MHYYYDGLNKVAAHFAAIRRSESNIINNKLIKILKQTTSEHSTDTIIKKGKIDTYLKTEYLSFLNTLKRRNCIGC